MFQHCVFGRATAQHAVRAIVHVALQGCKSGKRQRTVVGVVGGEREGSHVGSACGRTAGFFEQQRVWAGTASAPWWMVVGWCGVGVKAW